MFGSSEDDRYIHDPARCNVASVSSTRSTAVKWLNNDFGFYAATNRFYDEINEAHAKFVKDFPELRWVLDANSELSP